MPVAVIHTGVSVAEFGDQLREVAARGVFDSVGSAPMVGAVVWFVLFGVVLFICGQAIAKLEWATLGELPKPLGWSLLAFATLGVVPMPASGFWLAYPPAIAMVARKDQIDTAAPAIGASATLGLRVRPHRRREHPGGDDIGPQAARTR